MIVTGKFSKSLNAILQHMTDFAKVSGLCLNLGKCAVVQKGHLSSQDHRAINQCGLPVKGSIYYIGVLIGHVTVAQAFAKSLGEAHRRASLIASFSLSLPEIQLLKVWVLPVLLLTSRAYRAS